MKKLIPHLKGFTLIELVITLAVASVITVVVAELVRQPVSAYMHTSQRAQLVDSANNAVREIHDQLSNSLPNSIRIGCGGECLEFLHIKQRGYYRSSTPGNTLDFINPDTDGFESIGGIPNVSSIRTGSSINDCLNNSADCIVINNLGTSGNNAYARDNIAAITSINSGTSEIDYDLPGSVPVFPTVSADQEYYIVDTPITYLCDVGTNQTLRSYSGYPIVSNHSNVDSHAELSAYSGTDTGIVANQITSCAFSYSAGLNGKNGLVSVEIQVSKKMPSGQTESVNVFKQIKVGDR